MTDLEERVERLEEELGIADEPDLPKHNSWQMVEQTYASGFTTEIRIYRDGEGDAWVSFNDEWACIGRRADEFVEALEEANRDD